MVTRISTAIRNGLADLVADAIDVGTGAGTVRVYTGTQPAGPDTTASGTLLLEITLNEPAFGGASTGVVTLDNDPVLEAEASDTGTAGWFRLLDGDDVAVLDGAVTVTGGGGELELSAIALTPGITVSVTGGTITMPASA